MALTREVSLGVGLATAALVYVLYQNSMPSVAEARVSAPEDRDLAASERTCTWKAAALVTGIAFIAQDPTVFVIGGLAVVAEAWTHRHANAYDPTLGRATMPSSRAVQDASMMTADAGYSPSN